MTSTFSFQRLSDWLDTTKKTLDLVLEHFKGLFTFHLFAIAFNIVTLYGRPALLGLLINRLTRSLAIDTQLILISLLIVGMSMLPTLVYTLQHYLEKVTYLKLDQFMELTVLRLQAQLDIAHHENPEVKDLINKVHEETHWRMKNFAERLVFIFEQFISLLTATVILGQAYWWIPPILLLVAIPDLIIF